MCAYPYVEWFPGTAATLTADKQNHAFLHGYPDAWQKEYRISYMTISQETLVSITHTRTSKKLNNASTTTETLIPREQFSPLAYPMC